MRTPSFFLAMLGPLALAACERAPADPEPTPSPDATATVREPVSIIRPDIEVEREPPPLAPLEARIGFPKSGTALDDAAKAQLATVLESPQVAAGGLIVLRGHSDSSGGDEVNLRASQARAEAVREWLVEHGVGDKRIRVIALGEQNPIAPNALPDGSPNEAGRAVNRRVDLSIAVPGGASIAEPTGKPETLIEEFSN